MSTPSPLGEETTGIFDARIEMVMTTMFSTIAQSCVREMPAGLASPGLMNCMEDKAILAMEPSGAAKRYCSRGDIEEAFKCALQGIMLMKLREKSDTPVTEAAWKDIEVVLTGEATVAAMEEAFECMRETQGAEAERSCMADNFARRLGGDPADARQCLALEKDEVFGQCLGEAAALSVLETAAKRIES